MARIEAAGFDIVPFKNKRDLREYVRRLFCIRAFTGCANEWSRYNKALVFTEYGVKQISWVDEARVREQQAGLVLDSLNSIGFKKLAYLQVECTDDDMLSLDEDAQVMVDFLDTLRGVGLAPYFMYVSNDRVHEGKRLRSVVHVVAMYRK